MIRLGRLELNFLREVTRLRAWQSGRAIFEKARREEATKGHGEMTEGRGGMTGEIGVRCAIIAVRPSAFQPSR